MAIPPDPDSAVPPPVPAPPVPDPLPPPPPFFSWRAAAEAVAVGALFGLVSRVLMAPGVTGDVFLVYSVGFLLILPGVMGWIVGRRWPLALGNGLGALAAVLSIGILSVTALAVHLEGMICVAMMAPGAVTVAAITATLTIAARRREADRRARFGDPSSGSRRGRDAAILLLPFAAAGIEARLEPGAETLPVETSVVIDAPVETVWRNVVTVPLIEPGERATTLFHRIGFPQPLAATIDREGVGAVREATFERGVLFLETVTTFREHEEIAFTIDPTRIPPTAFDEHVIPGGRYFTTLTGAYRLEPRADGKVTLHLTSTSRLRSTVDFYSGPLVRAAMTSMQEDILRIVKARCERGFLPPRPR